MESLVIKFIVKYIVFVAIESSRNTIWIVTFRQLSYNKKKVNCAYCMFPYNVFQYRGTNDRFIQI